MDAPRPRGGARRVLSGTSTLALGLGSWIALGADRACAPNELGGLVSCSRWWLTGETAWPWFVVGASLLVSGLAVRMRDHQPAADVAG